MLDVLSYIQTNEATVLVRASFYAMELGFGIGILAALAGIVDRSDIRLDHPVRNIVNIHMTINLIALGLYGLNLLMRAGQPDLNVTPLIPMVLSVFGVAIILVSGYLGGIMV
jgi:uncharacterized membrane protein